MRPQNALQQSGQTKMRVQLIPAECEPGWQDFHFRQLLRLRASQPLHQFRREDKGTAVRQFDNDLSGFTIIAGGLGSRLCLHLMFAEARGFRGLPLELFIAHSPLSHAIFSIPLTASLDDPQPA